ncbi:protein phosphatase 1 regulatory subunit 3D [Xenopus laevis]|uniref:Protein phosphatase 1 regulatory subunit 3D n=2 Tax=Xenopus laevis TaxID=8355 RepID=A0A1L8ELJ1_XENLA|nr:protein phosphatase 1 regulatory subunit 3D [Xenopus laevis]OCT60233.1 hypothetical protein XELAEV_18046251mg [Xenopus laevis]
MSYKLPPFIMPQSCKQKVELSIPRSLSYINNMYQNAQLAEGLGGPGTKFTRPTEGFNRLPRAQSKMNTGCDPELRPIMRRRTKSLPSSSERKRAVKCQPKCHKVRFVDSLGLELAEVKLFSSADDPSIPLHVLSRLSINSALCCSQELQVPMQYLEPDFQQPKDSGDFLDRLQQQCVCLERVVSSEEKGISGTVWVVNLAFEKCVSVRYTFTNWKNYYEAKAAWQNSAENSGLDVFTFAIPIPPFLQHICSVIQFVIRYQVAEKEYWDNNQGKNYTFTYRSHTLRMPKDSEQSWIHFI